MEVARSDLMMGCERPWVIARLGEILIGLESAGVAEMVVLPEVTAIPLSPSHVRGITVRRGRSLPALDLRAWLGLPSLAEEHAQLLSLLEQREQDHRRWLSELQSSVAEERAFTLATDPHRCAFGRWYDQYHAPNPVLARHMRGFDAPHREIHALAARAEQLVRSGDRAAAVGMLRDAEHTTLAHLVRLFRAVPEVLAEAARETLLLLEHEAGYYGIIVDAVHSVSLIDEASVQVLPRLSQATLPTPVTCRIRGESGVVLALDAAALRQAAIGN